MDAAVDHHVSVELTRRSGITMRNLRLNRFLWTQIGATLFVLLKDLGLKLDDLYRAHAAGVSPLSLLVCGWGCRAP